MTSLLTQANLAVRTALRAPVRAFARTIGFDIVRRTPQRDPALVAFEILLRLRLALNDVQDDADRKFLLSCARYIGDSKAQLLQDLFALHCVDFKPSGFFVEFGATNGIQLSNTHILEVKFGWMGILAEPARCWTASLRANRNCAIDSRCVWTATGEKLPFLEASDAELSTIGNFASRSDAHATTRSESEKYDVETISLADLLLAHEAPRKIDYLSIDTEGSEYLILSHFDFDAFDIKVITVEHNYVETDRNQIHRLLTSKGYVRRLEKFSQWDDWYVRESPHNPI
jgi:FkbM family methyltransferase